MRKITINPITFWITFFIGFFLIPIVWYILSYVTIPFNSLGDDPTRYNTHGVLHIGFNIVGVIFWFIFIIISLAWGFDKDTRPNWLNLEFKEKYNGANEIQISFLGGLKKWAWITAALFIGYYSFEFGSSIAKSSKAMYNQSKVYQYQYQQKVESKRGFYDKLWKIYVQKEQIANLNKEVFIEVTKTIMENRADGKNVTWKWINENQHIPYDVFSRFYTDLSNFIENQREEYYAIELQCQGIAQANNTMLDTFPNNIYNRYLECPKINFEYGFLSDKTDTVFSTKKENSGLIKQ